MRLSRYSVAAEAVRRAAYIVAAVVAMAALWLVAASWLFVMLSQLYGRLDDPWIAWWLYASSGPTKYTKLLLAVSGILPLALIGALVVAFLLRLRRSRIGQPRSLYGDTAWAAEGEMARGGIRQSGRLPP
jgi:hypothetical protein